MNMKVVDALEWVRSRPDQFFASGVAEPINILPYIVSDVIEIGGGDCVIARRADWWVVGSDKNWFHREPNEITSLFDHVVPAVEHGDHSMRAEIIVKAFAKSVSIFVDGEVTAISGDNPPPSIVDTLKEFRCAILFRCN
jgi:hypothetical protein